MRNVRKRAKPAVELVRFGVSIPAPLIAKFDDLLASKTLGNRSEAIRDLIRERIAQEPAHAGREVQAATLTFILDTQKQELHRRVLDCRRDMGALLLTSLQARLNDREELHVLVLRGPPAQLREHADHLIGLKGVLTGKLVTTGGQGD